MPPQADGEEAAFALGVSMARPENRLIMLDVDEALLSNLGALVTISDAAPRNFVHVLFQSGVRSGKAGLPLPGGNDTDFATIARGAGYLNAYQFDDLEELDLAFGTVEVPVSPMLRALRAATFERRA